MRINRGGINGIEFWYRSGYSDLKTFEEVIKRNTYQRRGMKICAGERWMDCGANVGAFTLLACSLGASVVAYEPDPYSCELIHKNLLLNGFTAEVRQEALVPNHIDSVVLFVGNNNQVWRNSIVKRWGKNGIKVPAVNFDTEALNFRNCKMDIEGAEMPILEQTTVLFDKLVYEWSFDVDANLKRLWKVIERQKSSYDVKASWSSIHYQDRLFERWQPSWFPPCTNVFCFRQP